MLPEMLLQCLQQIPAENHDIPVMSPPDEVAAAAAAEMTVLERQIARSQWQRQQKQRSYFSSTISTNTSLNPTPFSIPPRPHILSSGTVSLQSSTYCGEQGVISNDLPVGSASTFWPDLTHYPMLGDSGAGDGGGNLSRTFSCPPLMIYVDRRRRLQSPPASQFEHASTVKDRSTAAAGAAALSADRERESSNKRKSAERVTPIKLEDDREKKIKVENTDTVVEPEVETSPIMGFSTAITTNNNNQKHSNCGDNNREVSSCPAKEKAKAAVPPAKSDYIHVRARRGQATDSHSLAERVRREKISERMKLLQNLVPGCNKITGKAGMLDEIINYVQSLQRQVEFLSMKLAAVTPALDFNLDALFTKEMNPACGGGGLPASMGIPADLFDLSFLQLNPLQQQLVATAVAAESCGLTMPVSACSSCCPAAVALSGVPSGRVSAPEPCSSFQDSCSLVHPSPTPATSGWDSDLQRFLGAMEGFERGKLAAASYADAAVATTVFPP